MLLKAYPDIDVADAGDDKYGKSILSTAFSSGDEQVIKLVMEHKSAQKLEQAGGVTEEQGEVAATDNTEKEAA